MSVLKLTCIAVYVIYPSSSSQKVTIDTEIPNLKLA